MLIRLFYLGINDESSYPSSITDELPNDSDQSVFDESSITDGPDEQEELDDDDDADDFEVLSFDGPPESSLYIKGRYLLTHLY